MLPRLHARFLLSGLSLLAVLWAVWADLGRATPGDVSAVHHRPAELRGSQGCAGCHGGRRAAMAEACLECHAAVGEQIDGGTGLHGALEPQAARRCSDCHAEHHGRDFAIISADSFRKAGIAERDLFDHAGLEYGLDGKHASLACSECHPHADATVLPAGGQRFLGLDQDCVSCHEDPHRGRMTRGCAECHGQELPFDRVPLFVHDARVPLEGSHGGLSCVACHPKGSEHSVEASAGLDPASAWRACLACHASPHTRSFLAAFAGAEGPAGGACAGCHTIYHAGFRRPDAALAAAEHATTGFRLDAPHDKAACEDCHDPQAEFRARYPGREADACRACHADPHGGQFDHPPYLGQGCLACHERRAFQPAAFDTDAHAGTRFPLAGRHREAACESCHPPAAGGRDGVRLFRGAARRCQECHADVHAGAFDAAGRGRPEPEAGRCAHCHGPDSFRAIPEGAFDHGAWTGFVLDGAHRQAGCESCHGRDPQPEAGGRSLGRVADLHRGDPARCTTCHADPHGGHFAQRAPRTVRGRQGCARCHQTVSFRQVPEDFDHRTWTGFGLEGAHARAACTGCHPRLQEPTPAGRSTAPAAGTACTACHADPHAGQFVRAGRNDCARCHPVRESFRDLTFDHARDTRFPLDKTHAPLDCGACHLPAPLPGGGTAVRYRPLGTDCRDCHEPGGGEGRGSSR